MRQQVILIGAARSGTKLTRDLLAEQPGLGAVPYDINYLWRIGNEAAVDDELSAPLPQRAVDLLTRELAKVDCSIVVEKTVSNCLRIPAVSSAFPDALFVFLVRDGFDVTESAMRQWRAPIDWQYTLRKALRFPWFVAPGYAVSYLKDLVGRRNAETLPSWGPRYRGIDNDIKEDPLHVVCAKQWAASNLAAMNGFDQIGVRPTVLRYEDLVADPKTAIDQLCTSIGSSGSVSVTRVVRTTEVGKGKRDLTSSQIAEVGPLIVDAEHQIDQWINRS